MEAKIFVAIACLLALKYTLELAGRTGSRRRKSGPSAPVADSVHHRARGLSRRWAWILAVGVAVVCVGWVSDRAAAPAILLAGIAILQAGAFLGGIRWARHPRRSAAPSKAARDARHPGNHAVAVREQVTSAHS